MTTRFFLLGLVLSAFASATPVKDWTVLIYMNAHNDLDPFVAANINQMENVGSNDDVNIVVQWASFSHPTTRRVYIQKDSDAANFTSPVIQDLPRVDMGDYRSLLAFFQWGIANYPAKHYYLSVGDHGSGWRAMNGAPLYKDISEDDFTKNRITTEQQGYVLKRIARQLGRRIDIFADDACLMGMLEVAGEFKHSVDLFIGSASLVPATGWPYDKFFSAWFNHSDKSPERVAKAAVEQLAKFYYAKSKEIDPVITGVFRMNRLSNLERAIYDLGIEISESDEDTLIQIAETAKSVQTYSHNDYLDLRHLIDRLEEEGLIAQKRLRHVSDALRDYTVLSMGTVELSRAGGVGIWFPQSNMTYSKYAARYRGLASHQATDWADTLELLTTSRGK